MTKWFRRKDRRDPFDGLADRIRDLSNERLEETVVRIVAKYLTREARPTREQIQQAAELVRYCMMAGWLMAREDRRSDLAIAMERHKIWNNIEQAPLYMRALVLGLSDLIEEAIRSGIRHHDQT